MWKVWLLGACLCLSVTLSHQWLQYENLVRNSLPDTSAETQRDAAQGVIMRLIPKHAHLFEIEIDKSLPLRSFQLKQSSTNGNIRILASDGISATKGFHHYLKYNLHGDVSWSGNQLEHIPNELPAPNDDDPTNIISQSQSAFIYYQNVCTWSYSFAWWSWIDWRRHIDWMALMGISLTIAPIQEQIWTDLYKDYGLSDDEIYEHFAGPAFLAWQRMGNIRGWAGPLTPTYRRMQLLLQKEIIKAQRNLGITVALPAFAGHLPKAIARIYPNETFAIVERWNRFPDNLCCPLFADPNRQLFREIGERFLRAIIAAYGSDHIYFSDPFNEIQPAKSEAAYLKQTAANIYAAMSAVDASAVWLLQGWMFVKNPFWKGQLIEAFLTAVPRNHLLVLDLQSEQFPQYERTHSYYGQPFIWCMLHNFGGTLGMHGSAGIVNTRIRLARSMENSTMLGVGIAPEGIDQNYVMYSLALERAWVKDDFDLDQWFGTFVSARYGSELGHLQKAWEYLKRSVYSYRGVLKIRGKYVVARRPATNLTPWVWYNTSWVEQAFDQMLQANLSESGLWRHDLVDLTRQFLQLAGDKVYVNLMEAYRGGDSRRFRWLATCMIDILYDMDKVLATHEKFLLGRWLASAKRLAWSPLEEILLEINARNQITTWGPNARILDYATKQWAGMVVDFHLPRWRLFLDTMQKALDEGGGRFSENGFRHKVFKDIESPFGVDRKVYQTKAVGDTVGVAQMIYDKWKAVLGKEDLRKEIPWQRGMSDVEEGVLKDEEGVEDEVMTTSSSSSPEVVAV
ncbi:alpha-N-acetylglucosaminidase [Episyrphus balteatus]|uniref:alpha-N-acetylglucosaminidase n=1 Tax=Episyrphus balteatus TaxID=286459 RepID=UPI0024868953|nr:alpha-N-acetylglucosaminidase [Episyrphus balteatus]